MAKITWTAEAQRWLEDIFDYIAADNPHAAAQTVNGIYERAQALANFPEMGHRYRASSRHVRIPLYGHYRIAYLINDDGNIDILGSSTVRSISAGINSEYIPAGSCLESSSYAAVPVIPSVTPTKLFVCVEVF